MKTLHLVAGGLVVGALGFVAWRGLSGGGVFTAGAIQQPQVTTYPRQGGLSAPRVTGAAPLPGQRSDGSAPDPWAQAGIQAGLAVAPQVLTLGVEGAKKGFDALSGLFADDEAEASAYFLEGTQAGRDLYDPTLFYQNSGQSFEGAGIGLGDWGDPGDYSPEIADPAIDAAYSWDQVEWF